MAKNDTEFNLAELHDRLIALGRGLRSLHNAVNWIHPAADQAMELQDEVRELIDITEARGVGVEYNGAKFTVHATADHEDGGILIDGYYCDENLDGLLHPQAEIILVDEAVRVIRGERGV